MNKYLNPFSQFPHHESKFWEAYAEMSAISRRAGYLEAARGKTGGYRLAREPEDIRLTEIISRFDTIESYKGCLLRRSECTSDSPCKAHSRWRPIAEQMLQFMDETSVIDLAE